MATVQFLRANPTEMLNRRMTAEKSKVRQTLITLTSSALGTTLVLLAVSNQIPM